MINDEIHVKLFNVLPIQVHKCLVFITYFFKKKWMDPTITVHLVLKRV